DEPILTSLLAGVDAATRGTADNHDREVMRSRILADNPIIKAANLRFLDEWSAVIAEHVAKREGCAATDPWPALVAQCVIGAVRVARTTWIHDGGDLAVHLAEGFAMLERLPALGAARSTKRAAR